MQLRSPPGQVAAAERVGVQSSDHRRAGPAAIPTGGDRVGVPSSDQLRDGTRCTTLDPWGPGCSCDRRRARLQLGTRLHAQPRTEHANRAGLQLRNGLEFHRVLDKQPTVLQSRYIMQQNATGFAIAVHRATKRTEHANRARLQLRNGSQFDRVISCGPGLDAQRWIHGDRVAAGIPCKPSVVETYLPPTNGGWMRKKTVR